MFFKELKDTIKTLNSDANNVANCEKAKKLRKKLIRIGLPLAICGYIGLLVSVILFVTDMFTRSGPGLQDGISALIPISFVLWIIFGFMAVIGSWIFSLGLQIVVVGYTTKLVDDVTGNKCPNCNETIVSSQSFCSKCGASLKKECPNCKYLNERKDGFCEKCGTKLD